jgi:hypothetical protein
MKDFKHLKTNVIKSSVNYPPISRQTAVLQYFTYNMKVVYGWDVAWDVK